MKNIFNLLAALSLCSCTSVPDSPSTDFVKTPGSVIEATNSNLTSGIPRLTQEEVIEISNRVVLDHNYDLNRYEAPDARYEYANDDNQWWVYYQLKPKEPFHHMSVFIHDKTKKIEFYAPK